MYKRQEAEKETLLNDIKELNELDAQMEKLYGQLPECDNMPLYEKALEKADPKVLDEIDTLEQEYDRVCEKHADLWDKVDEAYFDLPDDYDLSLIHILQKRVRVDIQHLRVERAACLELLGHLAEVNGGLAHLVEVKPRVAHRALERSDKRFRCGLGGAVGERGERSVNDVDTCHRSHQIDHVARAARVVQMCIRDSWWTVLE